MRINLDQKSMDMEQRDLNYILPAYIRNYLFQSKNEDPLEIVFPMFSSVPHPTKRGVTVPIRWVPEISPEAMEISVDGASVAEATEEEIAVKDEVDKIRKDAKVELGIESTPGPNPEPSDVCPPHWWGDDNRCKICGEPEVFEPAPEEVSPARAAFANIEAATERIETALPYAKSASESLGTQPTTREIKGPPSGPILPPGTPLDNMAPRDRGDQVLVAKSLVPEPDVEEDKEVEVDIKKPEEQSGEQAKLE